MIYQTLEQIAEPIIKAYHADLTINDRKTLAEMVPGDKALWTCRVSSTHLILLYREGPQAKRNALTYFDAICSIFKSEKWFLLEKTGERVTPMTAEKAREYLVLHR